MRARNQEGQLLRKGPNWVLRVYEDRMVDGKVQRVRVPKIVCRYSDHPLRGTNSDLEFLRKKYADKISGFLAPLNKDHAITTGAITLADFVETSYWPRCEWRFAQPAGNEFHIRQLPAPVRIVFFRVTVDRLIRPAMHRQIRLAIAFDIVPPNRQSTRDRRFEDARQHRSIRRLDVGWRAHVHRNHSHRTVVTQFSDGLST